MEVTTASANLLRRLLLGGARGRRFFLLTSEHIGFETRNASRRSQSAWINQASPRFNRQVSVLR